jgi:hypothetical protein
MKLNRRVTIDQAPLIRKIGDVKDENNSVDSNFLS